MTSLHTCIICKTDFLCELPFLSVFYRVKAKNPRFSVTVVRRKIISKLVKIRLFHQEKSVVEHDVIKSQKIVLILIGVTIFWLLSR